MDRLITGFHPGVDGEWIADLACGHQRHVRHNPPWEIRPWILDEASRRSHLGTPIDCGLCDAPSGTSSEADLAYRDARFQGLCHDGAAEVARTNKEQPHVPQHQDPVQFCPPGDG